MKTSESRHDRSMRQWNHNALLGALAMIESNADRIFRAETTTPLAKTMALSIKTVVPALKAELKTRVDPE